jgi:hypothetical protein
LAGAVVVMVVLAVAYRAVEADKLALMIAEPLALPRVIVGPVVPLYHQAMR